MFPTFCLTSFWPRPCCVPNFTALISTFKQFDPSKTTLVQQPLTNFEREKRFKERRMKEEGDSLQKTHLLKESRIEHFPGSKNGALAELLRNMQKASKTAYTTGEFAKRKPLIDKNM